MKDEHYRNVETYIAAAKAHGENDDPDHEVGDLQDMLREAFKFLTKKQIAEFANSGKVLEILELADSCIDCGAVPGTEAYGTVGDGYGGRCGDCADAREAKRGRK